MITGISWPAPRRSRSTSKPSRPGRPRSRITRSKSSSRARAEPAMPLAATVAAREALEDPLGVGGMDAGARVAHPEPRLTADDRAADRDLVAGLGMPDGVDGKVHHRLCESLRIGLHETHARPLEEPGSVSQ